MHSLSKAPSKMMMPSLMALLMAALGFLTTSLLFSLLITPQWGAIAPIFFFVSCGTFAFALSFFTPLAKWWRLILLFFPLILYLASLWAMPNYIYLAGFLLSASLFWSTYRTQVPFYPSGRGVWEAVANYLPDEQPLHIIDIGSGLGNFSLNLAHSKPFSMVSGIEIAPLPWLISNIRSAFKGSLVHFMLGNYERLDFSGYDVIFAYLSPAAMPSLWKKALLEMSDGSCLISHEFPVPGVESSIVLNTGTQSPDSYVYKICKK